MNKLNTREQEACDLIAQMPFPTFEESLDMLVKANAGWLWNREPWKKQRPDYAPWQDLLSRRTGGYIDLLSADEIRDLRRRYEMTTPMPVTETRDFYDQAVLSLERTGIAEILRLLGVWIDVKRDNYRRAHIVFVEQMGC